MQAHIVHRKGPATPEKSYLDFALEGWTRDPSKVALISVDTDEQLTYKQLLQRVEQMGGYLQSIGIESQSKVQFFCRNSVNALIAQQAAFFCNATVFNFKVNDSVKLPEYKFQTEQAEIEYVLTDATSYDLIVHQFLEEPTSTIKKVLIVDGTPKHSINNEDVILVKNTSEYSFVKPNNVNIKSDTLFLSYTSGSTGQPKGVMHSNFTLVASLHNSIMVQLVSPTVRFLQLSTLTYVTGVMFPGMVLSCGGTLILANHGYDPDIPILVEKYKVTSFILLECPMKVVVANSHRFPNLKNMLSSLDNVIVSGTLFPDHLREQMYDMFKGVQFRNIFGQTESTGIITVTDWNDTPEKHIGTGTLNMQARVAREDGSIVNVGEPGEIQWKGDQMLLGYWKRECDDWTNDGFFKTGDVGIVDEKGVLFIVGRQKEFIICLDERIAPMEIEDVLLKHPAVKEVIVVGVPHPVVLEAPTAMVIIEENIKKSEKFDEEDLRTELIEYVATRLVDYKQLHGGVHFVNELDKTDSGKYARSKITKHAVDLSKA